MKAEIIKKVFIKNNKKFGFSKKSSKMFNIENISLK